MTLWSFLKKHMIAASGQRLCESNAELTFEELTIFAEAFAEKLKGQKCCGIYCQSEMASGVALLSCIAAGVTALPLSYKYGDAHCKKILDTISPTCVICDFGGELQIFNISDSAYTEPLTHPAVILCTSGTTGTPKGVMLSEKGIMTNLSDIAEYLLLGKQDTVLISRPLYHSGVLTGEFLLSLIQGANIVFVSQGFSPTSLLSIISQKRITAFGTTPTLLRLLMRFMHNTGTLPLKHLMISGECMDESLGKQVRMRFPKTRIYHAYGLTEAGPRVSVMPPALFDTAPDSVGFPLKSVQIKILGKGQLPVKEGAVGMLWVRGENVMSGYYNAPELTQRHLQNGWLCTGDLATFDCKHGLRIKGRADDMIIRAGVNIYPAEIESALLQNPRVQDVLVRGVSTENGGVQLLLQITGDFESTSEVFHLCQKVLPPYQMPQKIELLKALRKSANGKLIRH